MPPPSSPPPAARGLWPWRAVWGLAAGVRLTWGQHGTGQMHDLHRSRGPVRAEQLKMVHISVKREGIGDDGETCQGPG